MTDNIQLIYPTELLGGCISIYRNIWDNPDETIKSLEKYSSKKDAGWPFVPANTLNKNIENKRTNYHMPLNLAGQEDEEMAKLSDKCHRLIFATAVGFNMHFKIDEPVYFNESMNVLKYQTGQEYKAHADGGTATGRTISPILYLNDDYEGGEIEFVNFGIKIKPEKGMLIIFPSSYAYTHVAHPVTSGTKYAIVTWLHDRPFDSLTQAALGL